MNNIDSEFNFETPLTKLSELSEEDIKERLSEVSFSEVEDIMRKSLEEEGMSSSELLSNLLLSN